MHYQAPAPQPRVRVRVRVRVRGRIVIVPRGDPTVNRNDIVALIDAVDAVVGHAPHGRTTGAITWRARPRGASTSTGRMCLLNATVCTVMPMWMVMRGIQLIGAGAAAQVGMVGPVATMFMATMLLGEPFTASMPAGTLLVVAGIAWLSRAK